MLQRKLAEYDLHEQVPVRVVESADRIPIGPFDVEWIAMTHSVPEPHALLIKTPVGQVFHSGDWKLDSAPQVGPAYDEARLISLGDEQIDVMVCDSTNATVPGRTLSEAQLYDGLHRIVSQAEGRVVVTCFGSNLARVATLDRVASATNRHIGLLGRSLINMVLSLIHI